MNSTTIIIVTYNAMTWIDRCLKSCENHPVIVVDNASIDATVAHIQTTYHHVTLLSQMKNLGFGQANNVGIRYALDHGAMHVFLLNQDAYLVDDVLNQLIAFQRANPKYGILSPIHITSDRAQLDKNFMNYMLQEQTGQFYSDFVLGNKIANVYEVPFVNAAAWLLSRECIETVGGFDPLFFHYGEDDNLCQRIIYHNYKIGVLPAVYVIHDRADRIRTKPQIFSEAYYNTQEKKYKVLYANILNDNYIENKIVSLSRMVVKLYLKLKFERGRAYQQELQLLKKLQPLIANSRQTNQKRGRHYI